MIHQFRDKKESAKRKRFIQNLIVFGVFVVVASIGGLVWSSKIFHFASAPIWKVGNIFNHKIDDNSYLVRTKKSVFLENENLLNENSDLKMAMINYNLVKTENDQLKELLGRIPEKSNLVLGNILAKPSNSPYDTIVIDIGKNQNIEKGDTVYANGSVPIGIVDSVYGTTSLIALYSSPNQKTEAMLEGSNASVELVGRGGGNFEMMSPIDLEVNKSMTVVLASNPLEIVAFVEDIISSPTDPIKKVLLSSPVNIENLKWVQVKKTNGSN